MNFTAKQKYLILFPLIVALVFSMIIFIATAIGGKDLSQSAQALLYDNIVLFFFMTLLNLIPAAILSLLLGVYVNNNPNANQSLLWLLICGLVGGYFPVLWFYWTFYFSAEFLTPVSVAMYGLPPAYLIGMITGYIIGRIVIAQFPTLFKD